MPKYWLPWLVGMPAEQSRAACCLIFGGVLERLPRLKVCLAHGGGSFPYTIGRIEHGFNMRPDLVATDNFRNPREYLKRLYFDSWVADERALRYLLDTCGVSTGSCWAPTIRSRSANRCRAKASNAWPWTRHNARLYHGTALEWLGLNQARFLG
jgi:aminocarboxymuconate-semialdehyde decarboxylase